MHPPLPARPRASPRSPEPVHRPRNTQSEFFAIHSAQGCATEPADSTDRPDPDPHSVRNSSVTSPIVRAIGPIAPSVENGPTHGGRCPRPGIRPGVGFSEQMPVKCAGTRTDPPLSLPNPAAESPAAIAADSPPLDPPGERSRSHGFNVRPCRRFAVSYAIRNSGQFVVPRISAPAARSRATTSASSLGTSPAMQQAADFAPVTGGRNG